MRHAFDPLVEYEPDGDDVRERVSRLCRCPPGVCECPRKCAECGGWFGVGEIGEVYGSLLCERCADEVEEAEDDEE